MTEPSAQTTPPTEQSPAPQTPPSTPAATTTPTSTPEGRVSADAGWTPYTPDSTKSAAENLVLKEAYDAKAPEGHDPNVKLDPKAPPTSEPPKAEPPKQEPPKADTGLLTLADLTPPDGFEIDPQLGTDFLVTLNQHKGDPKALANALIGLQVKAFGKAQETDSQAWDKVQNDWKKLTETDPEVGGAKYPQTLATSKDIVSRLGGEKLSQVLELTGMGNHPEWHRFISRIAPFVTEAKPIQAAAPVQKGPQYTPTNLYPDQDKK